jgi:ATP-dependent helicase HepA
VSTPGPIYELSLVYLEDNSELGPARMVFKEQPRRAELLMLFSGTTHPYRRETRLRLFPLPVGTHVHYVAASGSARVPAEVLRELPQREEDRRRFVVLARGEELEADEAKLEPVAPKGEDLIDRLRGRTWDSPPAFFARRGLLQQLKVWYEDTEGLPTLTGARVRSMAHQIYAVQRVLWARTPRFVLADEVGLGKTIEAGLILQALMATKPDLSVLVIAPGSMTRQWLCELYLRFGARPFQAVSDLKQPFGQQVIVSTTTLNRQPADWTQLTSRHWGMVVIDEAHQHPPGSPLFGLYREISQRCDGILVLSATPSKRELRGILGLLSLVAPDQYHPDDERRLRELWAVRQDIWDRLGYHQSLRDAPDFLEMPPSEFGAIAEDWKPLLQGDDEAARLLERLENGERAAFDELEAYVQEHYRVDHRIIRTRRRTIQSLGQRLCQRTLEVVEYAPTAEEALLVDHVESRVPEVAQLDPARRALAATYLRLVRSGPGRCLKALEMRQSALRHASSRPGARSWWDELLSDPSPEEEELLGDHILREVAPFPDERPWLDHAVELARAWSRGGPLGARHRRAIEWIDAHLKAHPAQKLLVFTEDREIARGFAEALGRHIGRTVEAFHWVGSDAEEERLKRITSEFQRSPSRPVLVSDELGGEGRNFQMAEAVLHLDCPWAVARLEQRIGRLDRIGREADRPVRSVVFLGGGAIEREIHKVHADIFRVHERSLGGLEFLLPDLQRRIFECALAGPSAMETQREALALLVERALRDADKDFDQSLDTSKHELERAGELVEILEEIDGVVRMEPIQYWARTLGLRAEARDGQDGTPEYRFAWTPSELNASLLGWEGTAARHDTGTFDRYQALEREDLQFFAPGHRLIDAQVRALGTAHVGRLTVFGRELGRAHSGKVFALILVHFDLDATLWTDEPFDTGLMARARRRLYPEVIERSLMLRLEAPEESGMVEDPALRRAIEADYKGRGSAQPVNAGALANFDAGSLSTALERAMKLAVEDASIERGGYADDALTELEQDLAPEMGFLRGQLDRTGAPDAGVALQQRQLLLDNLTRSRVNVAGVAVILGV